MVERYTLVSPYHIMKIAFPLYRRMERNVQLLEYKCQPFTEELLYERFGKQ